MAHIITLLIFHLLIIALIAVIISNIKKGEERKYRQMLKELEEKQHRDMQLPPPSEKKQKNQAPHSARESLLLKKLTDTIMENYSNPEFGVDEFADAVGLSRSSLNRKMREILQTTANNYIRDIRIEKAEELLRTSSLQINEICYKVGFQTPSYFIKCFRKKYGKSPNEYANS